MSKFYGDLRLISKTPFNSFDIPGYDYKIKESKKNGEQIYVCLLRNIIDFYDYNSFSETKLVKLLKSLRMRYTDSHFSLWISSSIESDQFGFDIPLSLIKTLSEFEVDITISGIVYL